MACRLQLSALMVVAGLERAGGRSEEQSIMMSLKERSLWSSLVGRWSRLKIYKI